MESSLLEKIARLSQQVEELQAEKQRMLDEGSQRSFPSDREARLMKTRNGFVPAYNVQSVVDSQHHLIGAMQVTDHPNDFEDLQPSIHAMPVSYTHLDVYKRQPHDPFVGGIHHFRNFIISQHIIGHISPDPSNYRIYFIHQVYFQNYKYVISQKKYRAQIYRKENDIQEKSTRNTRHFDL